MLYMSWLHVPWHKTFDSTSLEIKPEFRRVSVPEQNASKGKVCLKVCEKNYDH